jgi:hypothetical protein
MLVEGVNIARAGRTLETVNCCAFLKRRLIVDS